MENQPDIHAYRERAALDRLLLLIAVLIRHPGIGGADPDRAESDSHHSALALVAEELKQMAVEYKCTNIAASVPTLRKDLEFLRQYGIIENRMYRWGYYLGSGIFNANELPIALQAIRDVGQQLGDPLVSDLYKNLERRSRGLALSLEAIYPVRSQLNRLIVVTDPAQMQEQGNYRETLFEHLSDLEIAIIQGQAIELYYRQSPYQSNIDHFLSVYPLQLLYHDVAWYLIVEHVDSKYLAAIRIDRLSSHLNKLTLAPRGKKAQLDRLKVVQQLLKIGWGISLGSREQQEQELAGAFPIKVKVRFFAGVAPFIVEGQKRHPKQKIKAVYNLEGRLDYVDYTVSLPDRALDDFWRWVRRFGSQAQVLSPLSAVELFKKEAQLLVKRYESS
jgi:predicted DNA-binding transcriptional regulator YafY